MRQLAPVTGIAALLALGGCIEAYMPDVGSAPNSYLVVDGFLNGNGRTRLRLSRTFDVAATAAPPVEKGAKVTVLDDAGRRYPLTESSPGYYLSDSLLLDPARQYQLNLLTASGASYASDLGPLLLTPPIDQLAWQATDTDVQVQVSTHDPRQQARYYRWGYTETWEYNSAFDSKVEYSTAKKDMIARKVPIYTCWRMVRASAIRQSSSAGLSQPYVLPAYGLLAVPSHDERLRIRYSVLVTQVAETAAEFNYYELLRKNTEAVGTVNDPLPTQLTGNVHRTNGDANEPVLGYVSAHTVQVQRLFIDRAALPYAPDWSFVTPYQQCMLQDSIGTAAFDNPNYVPVAERGRGYYSGSTPECVDCRLRGTNIRPSFW